MKLLRNIPIALVLPAMFFALSLSALGMMGASSYYGARALLLDESHDSIGAMSKRRASEIETWFAQVEAEVAFQASSPNTATALRVFGAGWKAFDGAAQAELTRAFITDNPNPEGERAALDNPEMRSAYSRGHKRYHPFYRGLAERAGFADVFLFDKFGNLVYSVEKRDDFASSIAQTPQTALSKAVQSLFENGGGEGETVTFVNFAPYAPVGGALSAFALQLVKGANGAPDGVFAVRLSTAPVEQIMARTAGNGAQGNAFLLDAEQGILSSDAAAIDLAPLRDPAPLNTALAGRANVSQTQRDVPLLSGFQPVMIDGVSWVAVVETAQADVFNLANKLRRDQLMQGLVLMALFGLAGIVLGRGLSRPLKDLSNAISAIRHGDYGVTVPGVDRGDEIGSIGKALAALQTELVEAEAINADSKFQSAAVGATSAALMMTDANFCVTHMNQSIRKLVRTYADDIRKVAPDFDPDGCIGMNMDVFHRAPEAIRKRVGAAAGQRFTAAIPLGDIRLAIDVQPFFDDDGELLGSVVEWSDATEETRRNAIIQAIDSSQVFAEFDDDGRLKYANAGFFECCNLSLDALRGVKMLDMFSGCADDNRTQQGCDETHAKLLEGDTVSGRFVLKPDAPDAKESILEGSFSPIRTRVGSLVGYVLIGNDITVDHAHLSKAEAKRAAMEAAQTHMVEQIRIGMQSLAQGDLTTRLDAEFAPEYEQLRGDFNAAVADLARALEVAAEESLNMRSESAEISNAAEDMAIRSERQAATLRDTANALDEMTTNVHSAAEGAARTETVVREARTRAERSEQVVGEAVGAMSEIEASSQEIVKVISVIDEIAFQTNLLALNAGVEAARAGEAGRGFAVVATEVRALAQRCSDAAGEINTLLRKSGEHVDKGVTLVGETGDALKHIMESVSEISGYIGDIVKSGREQSTGLQQINAAVMEIDQTTQQNAAMFEETSSASNALARRADVLARSLSGFKLGQDMRPAIAPPAQKPAAAAPAPVSARKPAPVAAPKPTAPNRAKPSQDGWATERRTQSRRVVIDRRSGAVLAATEDNIEESWEEF